MKAWQKTVIAVCLLSMAASCRNDPSSEKPKIEKIIFEESAKNVFVGDTVKVNITAEPKEAKEHDKIEYRVTESGIIEIMADSGNDGVVFQAVKRGSTVITAAVNGVVDYCSVKVNGSSENVIPYIIVPNHVMECRENERRSIVASLAGGTPLDDGGFIWSYTGQKVISLESTGNIGVFDTLDIGESVVTISHPKAQFSVNVLVYVIGNDEIPVYITTDNNVVNLKTTDSNYQYAVELRGGDSGDYYNFRHELLDGTDIIELRTNNNIGTINPKARGIARIGISHPKAAYRLEIVVIVNEETEYRYINVDKTLVIMEEGYNEILRAELIGDAPQDYIDKYIFDNENDNIINIQQSHNQFRIAALQRGRSVLKIKNEYADFDREVLVIVNGINSIYDNEVYITTNQNVITTEAGGDDVLLTMTLVGGNEADRNNFVWTVDDGSIISVESAHGTVEYKNRAALSNAGERFAAQAIIKAKKVGTAKITLENPKAKNTFSVIVKVYKKGVFGAVPVVINGPGIYKVRIGEKLPAYLRVVTGSERNFTNVTWNSENSGIVSVSGAGLTGMLEGKSNGITTITVSGDNVKHSYTATVIVGSDEYVQSIPFMYVANPFMSVIKGESASFRIMCENMSDEEIAGINAVNNSGDIMEVFAYKNNVTVTGIALGEGEIIIGGSGLNTLRVVVMVEDYDLNPDMPYYLRTDTFIYGLVKGRNLEIGVDLVGGSAANERNIIWTIEDSNVAMISGNGKKCVITGRNAGQTVIKVKHPKSHNELEMVIYAVENESELNSKVIMYAKEANMLLNMGETRYISIITNASDAQKNSFQWDISNSSVIDVSVSGDRIKAYVAARSAGNAAITVRSGNQVPVVVYVSVLNKANGGTYINVPSIVEMAAGQTMSVNAVINNIYDKMNITWKSHDGTVAAVYGNGDTCLITAFKGGNTVIRVEYAGFVKDILLYVYNSLEEMASEYIIAGEQSRYIINKGDIVNLHLVFGMRGYPEHELHNIWWRTNDNTVIAVTGNGKTANVKGLNAGTGTITVSGVSNTVEIEIEVRENGKAGQYWFSIDERDRIKGILAGGYAHIEVRVFNGTNEVFNISGIEYMVERDDIISVTANGNSIRVDAAAGKEGQSYITIKHDSVEDARILIYTALSEYGLENAYPILVGKANYLIKKGENVTVRVETKDDDSAKLRNISYGLERNNGAISVSERNKREIVVNANNAGSDIIVVRYNAEVVQRIYVSVTESHYRPNAGYLITENIIGLLWDTEYETTVETNIDDVIIWKKQNDYVIDITGSAGKSAVIKGTLLGKTILTVSAGGIERSIVVFVCRDEEELHRYQAVNIEQRQYRIRKNESVTINIHSYQGKVEGETRYGDYYNYDTPYGNVISVNAVENNKFSVKGINEGMAAIRVTNEFYKTEMVVYIEVAPAAEGNTGIVDKQHYITAGKTLYVINKDEQNVFMSVNVMGDDFYGDAYWIWSDYDENIISVNAMGRDALVNPVTEGQTKIKVTNKDCANSLEITVLVGERFAIDNDPLPYIYVEKDLYEITKDSVSLNIPYSIVNVHNVNVSNVRWTYSNTISVNHDAHNGVFVVTPRETGIARFEITYGNLSREVYVLVKENMNSGSIYLTTSENYVAVSIGELRTVNIQLAGYDELINSNFKWSIDDKSPKNVLQLVGNGAAGQIYGISEGDVVVKVEHLREGELRAKNTLTINVKVVKDKAKERVVYLTTQRNVIETVVGTANEQIYVQKVGGDVTKTRTTWTVSDTSIVGLTENQGYAVRLQAKKEGVARIKVENEEADYPLEMVIIVKAALNNNIYISSDSSLLWLSPGEANKRIQVKLVNGDVKDNNRFIWKIENQAASDENVVKANGKVISIVGSNEECLINAVNEGTAWIRVSNPERAERDLIITVYVSHYKKIEFSLSRKEIVIGENEFVGINLPAYEYLKDKTRVWVEDINGRSTDVCDVFYTNSLVLLSGRRTGTAVIKAALEGKEGQAQMLVSVVEKADPNVNRVVIGKTVHILSMKSNPVILNATVSGPNKFDSDYENIWWKIDDAGGKIIDITPKNVSSLQARGRSIQITPKGLGTAVITVGHPGVDEAHWRQISVIVADLGNRFTVNRTDITVNSLRPETVAAQIVGGTTKDYEEVKWIAKMQQKWDGTMLEVVRIMGSGREVTLYPMNDGETEVLAFYNGDVKSIKVAVVSDYYFSFRTSNEYMWPGERRDLPFDVKPVSSAINWINVSGNPNEEPVITYGEVLGSSPGGGAQVNRYLQVEARREGTATVTGMANGKIATVNILVKYDYSFVFPERNVQGVPKYANKDINGRVTSSSTGVVEAVYTVHPANTYIKPVNDNIPGLEIEVLPPVEARDSKGRTIGTGKIRFTGLIEMRKSVQFQQYKARTSGVEGEVKVEGGAKSIDVLYVFPMPITPIPYFVRGDGKYSNIITNTNSAPPVNNDPYRLASDRSIIEGEKIPGSGNEYSLYLGDGEVHYILLDKQYDNAELNISDNVSFSKTVGNVTFTATLTELPDVNGVKRKAIRLSGGTDYIDYNRVAFNKELYIQVESKYVKDRATTNSTTIVDLFEKSFIVESSIPINKWTGPWMFIEHPSTVTLDRGGTTANPQRVFYLLKNSAINNLSDVQRNIFMADAYRKRITEEIWLDQYYNSTAYTYYFTGEEYDISGDRMSTDVNAREFHNLLNDKCDMVRVYQPRFHYSGSNYRSNRALLDTDPYLVLINTSTNPNNIDDAISYINLGNLTEVQTYTHVVVYEYNPEKLRMFDDGNVDYDITQNAQGQYIGWDKGNFNESMIPLMAGYNAEYLYSTTMYNKEITYTNVVGASVTSTYNVLRDEYVNNYMENVNVPMLSGVTLNMNNEGDIIYSRGGTALTRDFYGQNVCFCTYINLMDNFYPYRDGRALSSYATSVPILGPLSSNRSYYDVFVRTDTRIQNPNAPPQYQVQERYNVYNRVSFGHSRESRNIFGRADTGDNEDLIYDKFSDEYYTGRIWHNWWRTWTGRSYEEVFVYFSQVSVRQKLLWHDRGTVVIAPYYIFNRFPFRFEDGYGIWQPRNIVKLNDSAGGGKPMPSISRGITNSGIMQVAIPYTKFNMGSGNPNETLIINVTCSVRPCHSQYMGDKYLDNKTYVYNQNENVELVGEYRTFGELFAKEPNNRAKKFLE